MRHLFLSPHLDDAVLSCGGTIADLVRCGEEVTVLTFFAGEGVPPFAPLATDLHTCWGSPPHVVTLRRAEDVAALAKLGATAQHEDVPDAIYRRDREGSWLYSESGSLKAEPLFQDGWIPPYLAERVRTRLGDSACQIYAPLAIGSHVDHVLAFRAAELLADEGRDIVFYEDFPYLMNEADYASRLEEIASWAPSPRCFDEQCLDAKIDAFGYYRSQVAMVFEGVDDVDACFRHYARLMSRSQGAGAERFWRIGSG